MTAKDDASSTGEAVALVERVAALLDPLGGQTTFAARRVRPTRSRSAAIASDSGATAVAIRADDELPAASLAKIPIAIELFRRADLGQVGLDERLDTSGEPRVGGGGVLDYLDPQVQLTVSDLCFLMLAVSDNTVANFLLGLVGMGEVNHTLERLHLEHTRLARRFMDVAARAAHRENVTSAADMVTLLSLLRSGAIPGAKRMCEMLAAQQCADDLAAWLPEGAELAHKTGSLDDTFHDAGILTGPAGVSIFCVLTSGQRDIPAARIAVGHALRALWDAWCGAGA